MFWSHQKSMQGQWCQLFWKSSLRKVEIGKIYYPAGSGQALQAYSQIVWFTGVQTNYSWQKCINKTSSRWNLSPTPPFFFLKDVCTFVWGRIKTNRVKPEWWATFQILPDIWRAGITTLQVRKFQITIRSLSHSTQYNCQQPAEHLTYGYGLD